MKNIMRKRLMIIGGALFIFLLINVAISFSFFRAKPLNNESESTVVVNVGSASITYNSVDQPINNQEIKPDYEYNKTFSLTSTFTGANQEGFKLRYAIYLNVVLNEFEDNSFNYSLSRDASSTQDGVMAANVSNVGIEKVLTEKKVLMGVGYFLTNNATHTYNLKLSYPDTGEDQSEEIGRIFNAYVLVEGTNLGIPFEDDSWAEIAANLQTEDGRSRYKVGDTRNVTLVSPDSALNGKTFKVRVANNSNYDCTLDSKTACGFVVEFADIITAHRLKATDTNKGGWPATEMRDYLNNINNNQSIISALPSELRAVIIDTTVVSGHGSTSGETNFTSTDKLYLLSTREVWGNCSGGTNNSAGCYDYASKDTITRQLDYYADLGVVSTDSSKYKEAIKQLYWWLRSAESRSNDFFMIVNGDGNIYFDGASYADGVAPAFRLG